MPMIIPVSLAENHADSDEQLREVAQIGLLQELQQFPLVFKGGTALRFLHGSRRFSEDLDFDVAADLSDGARHELAEHRPSRKASLTSPYGCLS